MSTCPNGHPNPPTAQVCVQCAALIAPTAPGSGPPSPYGQPPGYGQPPYGPPRYGGAPPVARLNGLAVASLVLSLVWMCGLGSLLAVIFGVIALRQIRERNDTGRGMAIAGTVVGSLGLLMLIGFGVLVAVSEPSTSTYSSSGFGSADELERCTTDTKTLKTAMVAWNAQYLAGGNPNYDTPWPPSERALTAEGTKMLQQESTLHDLVGEGSSAPTIVKAPGRCAGEVIIQLD